MRSHRGRRERSPIRFVRVSGIALQLQLLGLLLLLLLLLLELSASCDSFLVHQRQHAIGFAKRRRRMQRMLLLLLLRCSLDMRSSSIRVSASSASDALPALVLSRIIVILLHMSAFAWSRILMHVAERFAQSLEINPIVSSGQLSGGGDVGQQA